MSDYSENKLKNFEKWQLAAHVCFGLGTLCLTIAALVQAASDGKLSDFRMPTQNTIREKEPQHGSSASDYFRGRL